MTDSIELPDRAEAAAELFPDEVVTQALVRHVDLPSAPARVALITLDNGLDHTKPTTFGPAGLASLDGRDRRGRGRHRGRRRRSASPASRSSSPSAPTSRASTLLTRARGGARDRPARARRVQAAARRSAVPTFAFVNGAAMGGGARARPALHVPHGLRPAPPRSPCPRSSSAWCPAGAAPTCCRTSIGADRAVTVDHRELAQPEQAAQAARRSYELGIADALFERGRLPGAVAAVDRAGPQGRRSSSSVRRSTAARPGTPPSPAAGPSPTPRCTARRPPPYRALDIIAAARTADPEHGFAAEDDGAGRPDHGRRAARPACTRSTWCRSAPRARPGRRTSRWPARSPRSASSAPA